LSYHPMVPAARSVLAWSLLKREVHIGSAIPGRLVGAARVELAFSVPFTAKSLEDSPDYAPAGCG
jgi:hypothetical protein